MKKIQLFAVGSVKEDYFRAAIDEYTKRLSRFCDFKLREVKECALPDGQARESKDILSFVDSGAFLLLDIGGEMLSSEGFSSLIDAHFVSAPTLNFVIGGSTGVDNSVKARASKLISFGRVTYPHTLMRVIFLEQLYRALTISAGLPYHK